MFINNRKGGGEMGMLNAISKIFCNKTKELSVHDIIDKKLKHEIDEDVFLCSDENKIYARVKMIERAKEFIDININERDYHEECIFSHISVTRELKYAEQRGVKIRFSKNALCPSIMNVDNRMMSMVYSKDGKTIFNFAYHKGRMAGFYRNIFALPFQLQ